MSGKGRWCRDVKRCETSWSKKQSWQCDEWLIKSIIQKNISLLPGLLIYYSWIIYYTHHPYFITVMTRTIHQKNSKYSSLWCSGCDIAVCKFSMNTELIVCQFLRSSTALFCVLMHYQAMPEILFLLTLCFFPHALPSIFLLITQVHLLAGAIYVSALVSFPLDLWDDLLSASIISFNYSLWRSVICKTAASTTTVKSQHRT